MLAFTELKKIKKAELMDEMRQLRQKIYEINKEKMLQKFTGDVHSSAKLKRQIAKIKHILSNLPENNK